MNIFPAGTLLQEEFAFSVEDEDVNSAVTKLLAVDFETRKHGHGLIRLIDHVKLFAVHALCAGR